MQTNIARKINRGMWVVTAEERIGILTGLGSTATVDLVNEAGETVMAVRVLSGSLRQALHGEIPASRRPDEEQSLRLGYLVEEE